MLEFILQAIKLLVDKPNEVNIEIIETDQRLLLKEPGFDAFEDLDDQIDVLLSGLMSDELMAACPRKPGTPLGKGMEKGESRKNMKGQGGSKSGKGTGKATRGGKGQGRTSGGKP